MLNRRLSYSFAGFKRKTMKNRFSILFVILALCQMAFAAKKDDLLSSGISSLNFKEYTEAGNAFTQYINESKSDPVGYYYRSQALLGAGNKVAALADINSALKLENKLSKRSEVKRNHLFTQRGVVYRAMEEMNKALADFSEALVSDPNDVKALVSRGEVFARIRQLNKSDADYKKALQIDETNFDALLGLAVNQVAKKQYLKAIEAFNKLDVIYPQNEVVYRNRCEAYAVKGDNMQAFNDMMELITFNEDYSADLPVLVDYATKCSNYALPKISSKVALMENEELWLQARAALYEALGQYSKAIDDYNLLESKLGEKYALLCIGRANCYKSMGDYNRAADEYKLALELEESARAYSLYADLQLTRGEANQALVNLDKAVALEPMNGNLYLLRAKTKESLGNFNGALNDYNVGLSVCKSNEMLLNRALLCLNKLNKRQQAMNDFSDIAQNETFAKKSKNCRALALCFLGKQEEAEQWQESVLGEFPTVHNYYDAASLYACMNKDSVALDRLQTAFELGFRGFLQLDSNVFMDSLRKTHPYKTLLYEWKVKTGTIAVSAADTSASMIFADTVVVDVKLTADKRYEMDCVANGWNTTFVCDTAGVMQISLLDAQFLYKYGFLDKKDIASAASAEQVSVADVKADSEVTLRSLKIGELELKDLKLKIVADPSSKIVLSKKCLEALGAISFDSQSLKMTIMKKAGE